LIVDPLAEDATPLDEHGPLLNDEDWLSFQDTIMEQARYAGLAALCGSIPPGISPEKLIHLLHTIHDVGCPTIVDTSGSALAAAIAARPYAIKVNHEELAFVLDTPLATRDAVHQAALALHKQGIALVIVSLGADGVLAVSAEGEMHIRPPDIAPVSTVGSGDSLLAGVATGLLQGDTLEKALQLGVACGAADALTIGGGLIDTDAMVAIQQQTVVSYLA
jgi:1-phosphofructokinase family hexose kinase